ncbi:MAG: hypothetical protein IPP72_01800 [Chitinophagaceae bacterium]|nr:hypothetical protein [Chitinophagaceae bacterium]
MNLHSIQKFLLSILCFFCIGNIIAQKIPSLSSNSNTVTNNAVASFGNSFCFIEQLGQYETGLQSAQQDKIYAGFEGFSAPVLFTGKGLVFLQKKETRLSHEEEEQLEKKGLPEEEIERRRNVITKAVSVEWLNANANPEIVLLDKTSDYYTYGKMPGKAYGYKKILYKNMYPGIDVVYSIQPQHTTGFEYSLIVHPGADPSVIRMKYSGDVLKLKLDSDGSLLVKTGIDAIVQSGLTAFESTDENAVHVLPASTLVETKFEIENNEVRFLVKGGYEHSKILVIDPFVSSAAALTGAAAGKAKDVDFDYAGNVYVSGGGDGNVYQLAKYDATGVLQWTFSGTVNNPQWTFGPYFGGWVVEKTTGNIYLGQGFDFTTGFIVVRISTTGLYDNYITNGNPNFRENWKMIWNCNSGLPQIIVAGGGTNSNINLGLLSPPSVVPTAANISGIASIAFQDMADMVIDPLTNSMYTIYASGSVATLNNSIYKHDQPYSAATKVWNVPTGYGVLQEAANRPYLGGIGLNENSANMLAVNPSYLFYWDGKNLKALNKTTGALVGTPVTTAGTALMQGGIIADACNNVFVGDVNGTIKVYTFNGTVFNDAAVPDITIPGFGTQSVYDLAYNETQKLLYASGDGFVTAIDVAAYCPNTVYTLTVTPDCVTAAATATLSPLPPAGSTVTYALFIGTTRVTSNTTALFTTLSPGVNYKITATINQACSGTQSTASFLMPGPTIGTTQSNAACGFNSGTITATGSGTAAPYTYSIDGANFLPAGNFTGLAGGVYTITVKDAGGCISTAPVTIVNNDGPALTFIQTNADCGSSNATVTANATGGTAPYQYSINGGITYQNSTFFTALLAGKYTLIVKDATGCTNAAVITITSSSLPSITAIPAAATCGNNNGLINAFGSGGTAPYEYSIDANIFQATNTFANLTPGIYTVTVKDANGCSLNTTVAINNTPAPTVTATTTQAACANTNGSITVTGTGGLAPLQYSINNGPYQSSNVVNGLFGGIYTISVQDIAGCTGSTNATVTSVSTGPTVTAFAVPSACNINNGSITASSSGGIPPYQYSITNATYQAGTVFSGLAPGNFVVFAKDAAGCVNTFSIVVPPTSGPILTVAVTPSSCLVNDGAITVTATGGTGVLTYSIDGLNFVPGNTFTGLAPNIYTVAVKDANGCSRSKTLTVDNASGLTLAASSLATSCSGSSGSITATAGGGAGPLQYSINGISYQLSNTFSSLAAGSYTAYVKDANGCVITKPVTISAVSAPALTLNALNATCATASGAILAFGSGGVSPLTYNIDGGAFSSTNGFVNLTAGVHTVVVKDAGGCTALKSVTITNSAAASAPTDVTFTVRNALPCTGGVVKIKNLRGLPSGGGNHYDFSLDFGTFTGSNTFTGVFPGIHIITAVNDNGCTVSKVAAIGSGLPASATATATGTACGTTNGTITINGVGGNTPYHASIDGSTVWQTFFPPGANSFTFNNLAPGTHTITMADDADFTVGPPDIPGACLTTILVTVPTIGGPAVATVKFDGTCSLNDGSITASGTGFVPLSFNINGGAYQESGAFTNLATGAYTINMQDGNGCISSTAVSITNPSGPLLTAAAVSTSCNLNNGSITASSTNGVGTVQYSLDGFTFQASSSFTNLAAGTYVLYAKDANGCYNSIPVTVAATALPRVTAFTIAASCGNSDGSIIAAGTEGTGLYQYSTDGAVFQSSTTFSGLAAGSYAVTIKDARGCTNTTGIVLGNIGAPGFTNTAATATCGNSNGSTTITASGGTAPYEYSSDGINFQPGNLIAGLAPGSNIITVKDANGCITPKIILVFNANGPQTLTTVTNSASCGSANGSITATATGGISPFQYSRDGITYQAGNSLINVPAGNYTLHVRDANACIKTLPVTVSNLAGPLVTAALPSPATCVVSDGTITTAVSGGTGTLSYSIDGSTFQTSNIFTGVAAGTYTITVQDAKGCSGTRNNVVVPSLSNLSVSASSTTATCGGNDASITATAGTGTAPYEYSLDGINFQLDETFNSLAAGMYTVTVRDANGCGSSTGITVVTPPSSGPKTWLGINTDWQDPVNWCGDLPVITDNVLIPTGLVNYPFITTDTGYAKNLTIQTGAAVVVTAAIQVADTITNQGLLDAVQGTVELNGSQQQLIAGSIFLEHTIHHLVISNTSVAGVVVSSAPADTLKISRKLSFGYDHAVLSTGNQITLLSSDTATASVGVIKENGDGSPMAGINGTIIVERYYPGKRAWRLITAPVKADVAAPSINTAWQENANPPSVTGLSNPDPHPSYGTHITGPFIGATNYAPVVTASGFDQSPQNNSSMKYYVGLTNSYNAVANTFTTKVTDRQGYLLFVRGDRSYDISTTSNTMAPASTVLRTRGNVNTGLVQVPADTGLQVIGNPYPSTIKFDDSMFIQNAAILKNQSFWLWDPLRGSAKNSPTNVGGWVPVIYAGNGNYISTYDPSQTVAGLDSAHAFDINGTIQSGAAFMIDNKGTATGNFVMHEYSKTDGSNNQLFRPAGMIFSGFTTNLFRTDATDKPIYWADGTMLLMDAAYNNAVDWSEDVRKVYSSGENICIRNNDATIAIEKRNAIQPGDTVWYNVNRLKAGKYRFELFFNNLYAPLTAAYFEDAYTGEQTLISYTDHNLVDVDVNADAGSFAANRFRIVFRQVVVLPVTMVDFSAWEQEGKIPVQWTVEEQYSVEKYVVEESVDGRSFTDMAIVMANQVAAGRITYHTMDIHPITGNNYYRLRIIDQDGSIRYSNIVLVTVMPGISYMQVSPNPVHNSTVQLMMQEVPKGKYKYELYNAAGQLVINGSLQHGGGNKTHLILPGKKMLPGIYRLAIVGAEIHRTVLNVAVQE